MLRVLAALCFFSLVSASSVVAQTAPDTTAAAPAPDSSSASTLPHASDSSATSDSGTFPVTVFLKDGTERHYMRVEVSGSYLIGWRADGGTDNIRTHNVARIMGDQTADVLKGGATVGKTNNEKKPPGKPFLRGQPLPGMKHFLMVQAGVLVRADDHLDGEEDSHGYFDVGAMKNVSPKVALGGTIGAVSDGRDYDRIAIKPRVRTWLGRGYAFDFAPGFFIPVGDAYTSRSPDNRASGSVGLTGEVAFVAQDWVAVTYVIESIEMEQTYYTSGFPLATRSGNEVAHYIGVKAGGTVGLILSVLTFAGLFANGD